jgi:formate hydrogenlyase subunit 6/NADH:ubiquinone oxidoreductase subunit I
MFYLIRCTFCLLCVDSKKALMHLTYQWRNTWRTRFCENLQDSMLANMGKHEKAQQAAPRAGKNQEQAALCAG